MPTSSILTLAIALKDKLVAETPALIDEVNASFYPDKPIAMPANNEVTLGIRTEMLKKDIQELPVMACGIYSRAQDPDPAFDELDGQQEFSRVLMPFLIDVYLGDGDADDLYIKAHKWGLVLDLFVERYASELAQGYLCDEAPALDISYVLELRDGTFRQLVSITGVLVGLE